METYDFLVNFFREQTSTRFFINLLLALIFILMTSFVLQKLFLFIIFIHVSVKERFAKIEIVNDFQPLSKKHKISITIDEVEDYLRKVKKIKPKDLRGIKKVVLCERHSLIIPTAVASYLPNESRLNIFPLHYNEISGLYMIPVNSSSFIQIDEKTAKEFQLFCLGHEIGHHVAYKKTGILHGDEVERFCDQYSENLGIVRNPERGFNPNDLVVTPLSIS